MLVYFVILLTAYVQGETRLDPLVETRLGLVKGLKAKDGDYSMFLGIPYAVVNETNVFGDAIPVTTFDNVFEAYDDTSMCPQVDDVNDIITGNLECLHLNIYTPNIATRTNLLPVIIWIHGGALVSGSAGRFLYGPKFLVRHDIVLVTINYRLGPYGFMCLDSPEVPGNQGLKDQYLAIQWVQENINEFGGDPTNITLMGESAGSKSIEAHLLTKRKILFNKVIMQSGSILGPKVVELPDKDVPIKLAHYLGYLTESTTQALKFLSSSNTDLVIGASKVLNIQFQMCIEKEFEYVEKFIHEHPEHSNYERTDKISFLIGFNSKELMTESTRPNIIGNPNYIKDNLNNLFYLDDNKDMVDIMRRFYIGDEPSNEMTLQLIDFISDYTYNYPVQRSTERFLKNNANVFQYLFSYDGERNFVKKRYNLKIPGAAHADELAYLFDLSYDKKANDMDQLIIDRMTALWTNFAKYGNPTPEVSELLPIKWKQATKEKIYYMNIDSDFSIGMRPFHKRLIFWDLFFEANENKHKAYLEFDLDTLLLMD